MAVLRRRTIDNTIEDKILTGMIVSDKFCRDLQKAYRKEYFVNPYAQVVAKWCLDYYQKYKDAPSARIQDIFQVEKENLKEADTDVISAFLTKISSQYEQEESFNSDYILDEAKKYFKKRSLKIVTDNVNAYLELNKIDEAAREFQKYRDTVKQNSGWINPLEESEVRKYFKNLQDKSQYLFQLPGAIGEMVGPFERGMLFSFFAPVKRGKSFWLQEIGIQSILERKKTIYIHLEMGEDQAKRRIYKRLTALGEKEGIFIYPAFDCLKNQDDTCTNKKRENKIRLRNEENKKPLEFSEAPGYKVCEICRGTKDFVPDNWFVSERREKMRIGNTVKKIEALRKMLGNVFRFQSYPAYSANLSQIRADISDLEELEGFIPDVVIIDYPDILAPEDGRMIGRERIDETWKMLKNMAQVKHVLVAVASQTNRASFNKKNVLQTDAAEDIRKFAHIDVGIALNQMPNEKKQGVVRVALIAERDGDFDQFQSCLVLQQLNLGQPNLDSILLKYRDSDQ